MIPKKIGSDAIEPGLDSAPRIKLIEAFQRFQKAVLREVFGQLFVPAAAGQVRTDRACMSFIQGAECRLT